MDALLDLLAGRSDSLELDRAALLMARLEYPNLDIEPFVALLDSYAVELAGRLGSHANGFDYVEAANQYLFGELGFTGNERDYYDASNSCLNDVLTVRTGIPITLSVVYMEIARRLAKPVYGIGLPGHFLVQYRDLGFSAYIDVYHGGRVLTPAECFELAGEATGEKIPADPRLLAPAGKRQILLRMLNNLRGVYMRRQAYGKALATFDLMLAADPGAVEEYKYRAVLHIELKNLSAARADLEACLRLAPNASDRENIEKRLKYVKRLQAQRN